MNISEHLPWVSHAARYFTYDIFIQPLFSHKQYKVYIIIPICKSRKVK